MPSLLTSHHDDDYQHSQGRAIVSNALTSNLKHDKDVDDKDSGVNSKGIVHGDCDGRGHDIGKDDDADADDEGNENVCEMKIGTGALISGWPKVIG
jgi:hypothetical protein